MIFHDDFDLAAAAEVVEKMGAGAVEVRVIEYEGLTPIARIGVEEISRRGEIVSPERLKALLKQSTRARINDTFLAVVCTNCWNYLELRRVGDMEGLEKCPMCGGPIVKLIGAPGFTMRSEKHTMSDKNLKRAGFKKLVKEGDGKYRNVLA